MLKETVARVLESDLQNEYYEVLANEVALLSEDSIKSELPPVENLLDALARASKVEAIREKIVGGFTITKLESAYEPVSKLWSRSQILHLCRLCCNLCCDCPAGRKLMTDEVVFKTLDEVIVEFICNDHKSIFTPVNDSLSLFDVHVGLIRNYYIDNLEDAHFADRLLDTLTTTVLEHGENDYSPTLMELYAIVYDDRPDANVIPFNGRFLAHFMANNFEHIDEEIVPLLRKFCIHEKVLRHVDVPFCTSLMSNFEKHSNGISKIKSVASMVAATLCEIVSGHQSVINWQRPEASNYVCPDLLEECTNIILERMRMWLLERSDDLSYVMIAVPTYAAFCINNDNCTRIASDEAVLKKLMSYVSWEASNREVLTSAAGCLRNLCVAAGARPRILELGGCHILCEFLNKVQSNAASIGEDDVGERLSFQLGLNVSVYVLIALRKLVADHHEHVAVKACVTESLIGTLIDVVKAGSMIQGVVVETGRLLSKIVSSLDNTVNDAIIAKGGVHYIQGLLKSRNPVVINDGVVALIRLMTTRERDMLKPGVLEVKEFFADIVNIILSKPMTAAKVEMKVDSYQPPDSELYMPTEVKLNSSDLFSFVLREKGLDFDMENPDDLLEELLRLQDHIKCINTPHHHERAVFNFEYLLTLMHRYKRK